MPLSLVCDYYYLVGGLQKIILPVFVPLHQSKPPTWRPHNRRSLNHLTHEGGCASAKSAKNPNNLCKEKPQHRLKSLCLLYSSTNGIPYPHRTACILHVHVMCTALEGSFPFRGKATSISFFFCSAPDTKIRKKSFLLLSFKEIENPVRILDLHHVNLHTEAANTGKSSAPGLPPHVCHAGNMRSESKVWRNLSFFCRQCVNACSPACTSDSEADILVFNFCAWQMQEKSPEHTFRCNQQQKKKVSPMFFFGFQ